MSIWRKRSAICETETGKLTARGDAVIGVDGAFSAVRASMQQNIDNFQYYESYLAHGYKELTIPPGPNDSWQMEKNTLHIWPRKSFMMIALPNPDGSFTCTLSGNSRDRAVLPRQRQRTTSGASSMKNFLTQFRSCRHSSKISRTTQQAHS